MARDRATCRLVLEAILRAVLVVEGAGSRRGPPNAPSGYGCSRLRYGSGERARSFSGCPSPHAYAYPHANRLGHAYPHALAYAYLDADADSHTYTHDHANPPASTAYPNTYTHADTTASLRQRATPELGLAVRG